MNGIIKPVSEEYRDISLDFTEKVFTEFSGEKEGREVRALVGEIRSKKYYLPELDLMMLDGQGECDVFKISAGGTARGRAAAFISGSGENRASKTTYLQGAD